MNKKKVLLLSGYHAASHRYWCEQLICQMPELAWSMVSLPARHFYWRIRSNALSLAHQFDELHRTDFDLLIATSMVDLSNLRGLLPHLSSVPTVLYFHENQFAYPTRKSDSNLINAQLTSIYSALCTDRLVFNSRYNRDTFFSGANSLLNRMPDGTSKDLLMHLPELMEVIPVPLTDKALPLNIPKDNCCIEIIWNHRWEYDKQPQVFFSALELLINAGIQFKVHVMGQQFREEPACFSQFKEKHGEYIETWGYQDSDQYYKTLEKGHLVVSTALHDFQGLGMLEAIQHGCTPVAPNRVAYPEYIPEELMYSVNTNDDAIDESQQLFDKLTSLIANPNTRNIDIMPYCSGHVTEQYRSLFNTLGNRLH